MLFAEPKILFGDVIKQKNLPHYVINLIWDIEEQEKMLKEGSEYSRSL